VSGLFAKLGMERRTQAAAYAARLSGDSAAGMNQGRGPAS
jgi:hypothetical protein